MNQPVYDRLVVPSIAAAGLWFKEGVLTWGQTMEPWLKE